MKYAVLAFALSLPALAAAQDDAQFRDMTWGASSKSTPGLKLAENKDNLKCYARPGDKLKVGDAALKNIRYCYYKDQLGYVMIDYKGQGNHLILKDVLDKKFGSPYRPNQFMETYWWRIDEPVAVRMDFSEVTEEGTIIYRYKPVSEAMSGDQSKSNADAANDL